LRSASILFALAFAAALTGCETSPVVDSPIVVDHDPADVGAQMEYWHGLTDRPVVSNNEALHGLILFKNLEDPASDYAGRVQWLRDNGYLSIEPGGGENATTLGTLAHILAQMLEVDGGLTMRLVGPNPRYALRELVYLGVMTPGTSQQGIAGIDFVGLLARAEAYTETVSQP
jgi:hypothetical protein